jgi:hypothetical protein
MPASPSPYKKVQEDKVFHKLNPVQVLVLKKLNKQERYIAYFAHCMGVVQSLTRLGYIKKRGGPFTGNTIVCTITPKGEEYLKRNRG